MSVSASKQQFIMNLQNASNDLLRAHLAFQDLYNYYFKNGFNAGGANVITDEDVAQYNLKAADVTNGITLAEQMNNFFDGAQVAPADYETTLQNLRTV